MINVTLLLDKNHAKISWKITLYHEASVQKEKYTHKKLWRLKKSWKDKNLFFPEKLSQSNEILADFEILYIIQR